MKTKEDKTFKTVRILWRYYSSTWGNVGKSARIRHANRETVQSLRSLGWTEGEAFKYIKEMDMATETHRLDITIEATVTDDGKITYYLGGKYPVEKLVAIKIITDRINNFEREVKEDCAERGFFDDDVNPPGDEMGSNAEKA